jgi:PAS domain S-box-containing protein
LVGAWLAWRAHALRSTIGRVTSIADALPLIVYLEDVHGVCTYANRRWSQFTGRARTLALGQGFRENLHPDDLRRNAAHIEQARLRAVACEFDVRLRSVQGEWRWFIVQLTPIRDRRGHLVSWVGSARDSQMQFEAALQLESALENARRVAATLQQALLPRTLPSVPGIAFAATYRSETSEGEIGGDWYDVFTLPEGEIAIVIGDVVGHGLDAASAMIRMREMLRAAAVLEGPRPDRILATVNRTMPVFGDGLFATAALAIVDPRTLRFLSSCAGHPWPRLLRGDKIVTLARGGLPLGVDVDAPYESDEAHLEPGDKLVLYTDGLIEASHDVIDGEARLTEALTSGIIDPDALVDVVAGPNLRDDVAVLTMTVAERYAVFPEHDPAWRFFSNDASTAAPARASLTAYLRKRGLTANVTLAAEVIFGELVGNVVRHAPGPIEVELFWSDSVPALVVRDRGRGFVPQYELPDVLNESGRGLFLIEQHGGQLVVMPRHGGGSDVMVLLPILIETGGEPVA